MSLFLLLPFLLIISFQKTSLPSGQIAGVSTTPTESSIKSTPSPKPYTLNPITYRVNQYRQSRGLGTLSATSEVCVLATTRAQANQGNLTHDGYADVIAQSSFNSRATAENLWWNSGNIDLNQIISDWNNSSPHKDNLNGNWTLGCGAIVGHTAAYIFVK